MDRHKFFILRAKAYEAVEAIAKEIDDLPYGEDAGDLRWACLEGSDLLDSIDQLGYNYRFLDPDTNNELE